MRNFLALVALGCLVGMTTKAWAVAADNRPDGEFGWQVHSGYGLAESIHLTGPLTKWELPAREKKHFSCRISVAADGLRMTVNKYGTREGAVIFSVKDGGFSSGFEYPYGAQEIYFRFDEGPWTRRLFTVTGGAMAAYSGVGAMSLRGKQGANAILKGLGQNHRHLQIRWVPLYGSSYRMATLNINGYGEASAECKRRVAAASSMER